MNGNGIFLTCSSCGKEYQLDEYGYISSTNGTTEFSHIPDWYNWQRECVKSEISNGSYYFESDVDIYILADMKCLYKVGDGRLKHSEDGFSLIGCEGDLEYNQKPTASYTLNVDYFWYEIGDVICLGNSKMLYYCFPKDHSVSVTKARFAAEELYKLS